MSTGRFRQGNVEAIRTTEVVAWTRGDGESRLFLPPIQRSVVWSNAQIVNYWDSLLRGYPAGLMMVHQSREPREGNIAKGRTVEGRTCEAAPTDFHLFDGQQRLSCILLGHQAGQLSSRLKLWVDLGAKSTNDSGLLFDLRISSTGQPFGYQAQHPNQKHPLHKRREKARKWADANGLASFESEQAFRSAGGGDLIDAVCAVPFHQAVRLLLNDGATQAALALKEQYPAAPWEIIETFVNALNGSMRTLIVFQLVDQRVVEDEDEYIRYFGRLGQGGTPLTNDELTYSILKHRHPEVHDRMKEIVDGPAGRVASEVNLVLAALRVAKVVAPWEGAAEWELLCRPYPGFVSRLKQLPGVQSEFQRMIPSTQSGLLKKWLETVRMRLVYDAQSNPAGLPVMLLARLPHQLVDVLILMVAQQDLCSTDEDDYADALPAFALYWLLFVSDHDAASSAVFKNFRQSRCVWRLSSLQELIRQLEQAGVAWTIPTRRQLSRARGGVKQGGYELRSWEGRFAELDADLERRAGNAVRVLSTTNELIKRALLWLQREYLAKNYRHFDPTSSRDEDLPVDLDHLFPQAKFGFHWRSRDSFISFEDPEENFRHRRGTVGNSLGNYRWLDAAENRSRGAGKIDAVDQNEQFIVGAEEWNSLIDKRLWSLADVAAFQRLVDGRTLDIVEELLVRGRLEALITGVIESENTPAREALQGSAVAAAATR